jgi:hypothetical protein
LPLQYDFALELHHRGEHVQHDPAGGAAGVDDVAGWRGSRKTTAAAPSGPRTATGRTPRSACNTSRPRQRRRRDARGAWFSVRIVSGNAAGCYRARVLLSSRARDIRGVFAKTQRVTKNKPFVNPLIVVIQLIAS